jgi:hypothetical protein
MKVWLYTVLFSLSFCGLTLGNCKDEFKAKGSSFDKVFEIATTKDIADQTFSRIYEDQHIKECLAAYEKNQADFKQMEELRFKKAFSKAKFSEAETEELNSLVNQNLGKKGERILQDLRLLLQKEPSLKKLEREGYSVKVDSEFPGSVFIFKRAVSDELPQIKTNGPTFCGDTKLLANELMLRWNILDPDKYIIHLINRDRDKELNACNKIELGEAIANSLDSRTYCSVSFAHDYTKIPVGFRKPSKKDDLPPDADKAI